jgi:hypothetical protein
LAGVTTKFHTLNAVVAWKPRGHFKMFPGKKQLKGFSFLFQTSDIRKVWYRNS